MNDYLVQYADTDGIVREWQYADSHLDAAAMVVIINGSSKMIANDAPDSYQSITVVSKGDYIIGSYTIKEVVSRANCIVGLSEKQWLPWAGTEDWQS